MKEPRIVRTFAEAAAAFEGEERLALDLETSGLSPWNDVIHVITLYGAASNTIAILHYPRGFPVPPPVIRWLETFPELVMHNGVMFDALFLSAVGMSFEHTAIFDTLIAEKATLGVDRWDVRVNLAATVKRHLGKIVDKSIEHGHWGEAELSDEQVSYVTGDIRYLLKVREKQLKKGREDFTLGAVEFERELSPVVIAMSMNGIPVDLDRVEAYFAERSSEKRDAVALLLDRFGEEINLNSPSQLVAAFNNRYGKGTMTSTAAKVLEELASHPGELGETARALLSYRYVEKRRSMFGEKWKKESVVHHGDHYRVHGRFWQMGAVTGRFTSTEPNLQQIPRDMRDCFGGAPGMMVGKTDLSAIEVRVSAALTGDRHMISAFRAGEDIHTVVAAAAFDKPTHAVTKEERQIAKALNFTLLFGGSTLRFQQYAASNGAHIDRKKAEEVVARFFERFADTAVYIETTREECSQAIVMRLVYPTGMRRVIQGEDLRPTVVLNNTVQGVAAAGLKKALVYMRDEGLTPYLSAVVHDEVVYVAPEDRIEYVRSTVDRCMIEGMKWALEGASTIPIAVESRYGETWAGHPETERKTEG